MAGDDGEAFHLVSHWRVPGRIEAVFDVLADGPALARWWPEVYREVRVVAPGDSQGRGQVLDLVARGRLPYALRWRLSVAEVQRPCRIAIAATGDLNGRGLWTLRQDGGSVDLTYDWRVDLGRGWMRRLAFLLRPVFAANHRWAMAQGERALRRELARRGADGAAAEARPLSASGER